MRMVSVPEVLEPAADNRRELLAARGLTAEARCRMSRERSQRRLDESCWVSVHDRYVVDTASPPKALFTRVELHASICNLAAVPSSGGILRGG
jgi:hypothetical protein